MDTHRREAHAKWGFQEISENFRTRLLIRSGQKLLRSSQKLAPSCELPPTPLQAKVERMGPRSS